MQSKIKNLLKVYSKIPPIKCQGLCHESCTIAPASKIEIRRIKETFGRNLFNVDKLMKAIECGQDIDIPICKALKDGRCSIYHYRPTICRLFGVAEGLECPFGCKPERYLTRTEARAMLDEVEGLA